MIIIKKKVRFIIFTLIFIVISPIVVLYAKGDIFGSGWSILKTGGIYVTGAPIGSEIFLNSKLRDTINFFNRDVLIKNLKKGTYEISVKKEGYNSWINKIKVSDNLVSDANIFMLSKKVELREVIRYNTVEKDTGTSTIKIKVKNSEFTEIATIFASTSAIIPKRYLSTTTIDFKKNYGIKTSPIMDGKLGLWKEGSKVYIAWFGRDEIAPKYLCEESGCTKPLSVYDFGTELRRINFLPSYNDVIIIALENRIIALQVEKNINKYSQLIYQGINPDFRIISGDLYIKDNNFIAEVLL